MPQDTASHEKTSIVVSTRADWLPITLASLNAHTKPRTDNAFCLCWRACSAFVADKLNVKVCSAALTFLCCMNAYADEFFRTCLSHLLKNLTRLPASCWNMLGNQIYCGASIGIAFYPDDGVDDKQLINRADASMFDSKTEGRNQVRFYPRRAGSALRAVSRGRVSCTPRWCKVNSWSITRHG